jgi:glycosyltransferase involved in cell wall biosynthesis
LTTQDGDYQHIDESLCEKVAPNIDVVRTHTPTFSGLYHIFLGKGERLPQNTLQVKKKDSLSKRFLYFLRKHFVAPDMRVIWVSSAVKVAKKLLASEAFDVIVSSGPPHSTHLICKKLQKKFCIPWCADFRDPWTRVYYLQTDRRNIFIEAIDRSLEKKVLRCADAVVTVSNSFKNHGLSHAGAPDKNNFVIQNAFDPTDYQGKSCEKSEHFRIKFVGTLTDNRRHEVFKVLLWIDELVLNENLSFVEMTLIGGGEEISATRCGIGRLSIRELPHMKHDSVIDECVNSEVLLLIVHHEKCNEGILPYRLYEYIGSRTYTMVIGPPQSDISDMFAGTDIGDIFDYEAKEAFQAKFLELYRNWEKGKCLKTTSDLTRYSLIYTSGQYAELLSKVITQKL